jgi:hypothetical protein
MRRSQPANLTHQGSSADFCNTIYQKPTLVLISAFGAVATIRVVEKKCGAELK